MTTIKTLLPCAPPTRPALAVLIATAMLGASSLVPASAAPWGHASHLIPCKVLAARHGIYSLPERCYRTKDGLSQTWNADGTPGVVRAPHVCEFTGGC
jgi:hypothetical protein